MIWTSALRIHVTTERLATTISTATHAHARPDGKVRIAHPKPPSHHPAYENFALTAHHFLKVPTVTSTRTNAHQTLVRTEEAAQTTSTDTRARVPQPGQVREK